MSKIYVSNRMVEAAILADLRFWWKEDPCEERFNPDDPQGLRWQDYENEEGDNERYIEYMRQQIAAAISVLPPSILTLDSSEVQSVPDLRDAEIAELRGLLEEAEAARSDMRYGLGVAIHTSLRRFGTSKQASAAWNAIEAMDDNEWKSIVDGIRHGFGLIGNDLSARIAAKLAKGGAEV